MKRLEGKVAIVTGGVSGIGLATVERFIKEGAKVVATDIDEEKGKEVSNQYDNSQLIFVKHDVADENDWINVVEKAKEAFGKVDILFNNAGIYLIKPIAETELEDFQWVQRVDVDSVFLGMKHLAPVLAENGSGSIINNSSVAGLLGAPNHVSYGAAKGAVRVMTKDLAIEYAEHQVRANSIHPGYVQTAMADYASEQSGASQEELGKLYPLGRLATPEDVANLVLFLASDESSYITGQEIAIDGGQTAS